MESVSLSSSSIRMGVSVEERNQGLEWRSDAADRCICDSTSRGLAFKCSVPPPLAEIAVLLTSELVANDRNAIKTRRAVAKAIAAGEGVVVIHGVDYNDSGAYDFDAGVSDLDSSLPAEATDLAACGVLID